MLQDATEDVICKLSEAKGHDVSLVDIEALQAGSIVQITTESSNIYLLEVIHEYSGWVYFTRYTHKNSRRSGICLGKQKLGSPVIKSGEVFTHNDIITKPVTKITLLCE